MDFIRRYSSLYLITLCPKEQRGCQLLYYLSYDGQKALPKIQLPTEKEIDLEDPYIYEKPKPINPKCHKACTNYKKCTGYADDATPADTQEAYKTCMQECQGWSTKTIKCMSKVRVRKAADCMAVSRCGLFEYTGKDIYNMR